MKKITLEEFVEITVRHFGPGFAAYALGREMPKDGE